MMLILLLAVYILYLFLLQSQYQTHTTIQDHQLVVTQIIFLTSSRADQDDFYGETCHSYDCTTSYPTDSVVIQGS